MTEERNITGGDELITALSAHGVEDVFGVPGIQLDGALDALARSNANIQYYSLRHEQAASYMADGYARATGKPGVCMVVPGPGMLNATAGLATAYACSSPMLFISGQIPTHGIGGGLGLLHEIPDQTAILTGLTKSTFAVRDRAQLGPSIAAAMKALQNGRPRPVALEIPEDVLHARGSQTSPEESVAQAAPTFGETPRHIAQLLQSARRPVIYAGWGVQAAGANAALLRVAEKVGAIVVTSLNGAGAIPADHAFALTHASLSMLEPDVILAVGSRFLKRDGSPELPPETHRLMMINAEAADMVEPRSPEYTLACDALVGLEAVYAELNDTHSESTWLESDVEHARGALYASAKSLQPQLEWLSAVRDALPRESYVVAEMTQLGYVAPDFYPVYNPRGLITSGYQGSLGFGFATALGVKVGVGDAPVVLLSGDGGFGWTLQELSTAARYRIGLISVVFRDDAYGNVQRIQRSLYGGRVIGSDLHNPDFVRLAESFGVRGLRVETPSELRDAITEAVQKNEPIVIEVPIGEFPDPWPVIS